MLKDSSRKLVVEGGERVIHFNTKQFKPVPEEGIEMAVEAMRAGIMYRYQPKEAELSRTTELEERFSKHMGIKHVVGTNSCGSAMYIALNIAGVQPGDLVLTNAFTFQAVPSVIHHARAESVLVDCTREWGVDVQDLERQVIESGAKVFVLSYMRGHVPDMDGIMEVVDRHGLFLVEECAHADETVWDGKRLGTFGQISCFSTQSSKGMSAGEGGLFCTEDDVIAAKAALYAGSYERRWTRHKGLDPKVMDELQNEIPGYSMRMQEVTASTLIPQVDRLPRIHEIHVRNWDRLHGQLHDHPNVEIPLPLPKVTPFKDTMQFHLVDLSPDKAQRFLDVMAMEGVGMQIFGRNRNARDFRSWHYTEASKSLKEQTVANIEFACDLSLQPHLTEDDIDLLGSTLRQVLDFVAAE